MAYYKDAQTWLNEEIRKPMKLILKYGSERDAMELLDFLCDMYIELQERADMYEEKLGGGHCGVNEDAHRGIPAHHDYDALPSPYTPEEEMKHREMLIYSLRNPDEWIDGYNDDSRFCPLFIDSLHLDTSVVATILTGLKKRKSGRGITNRDLARATGVSEQTISAILRGRAMPSLDTFAAIVGALGYDLVIRK